jgi:hypothetical protein
MAFMTTETAFSTRHGNMTQPGTEHAALIGALQRAIDGLGLEEIPPFIGELARLQALLWTRLSIPARRDADSAVGDNGVRSTQSGPYWLSVEAVVSGFGLTPRWLEDHREDLRRRHIISKPSRKATVFHARRLARFLEERSRP